MLAIFCTCLKYRGHCLGLGKALLLTFRRMRKKLALGLRRNVHVSTCYIRTLGFTIHVSFNVVLLVQ